MPECTRCGWVGAPGIPKCPRCGQPFAAPVPAAGPPLRPTLILRLEATDLPPQEWEITESSPEIGRLDDSEITIPHKSVSRKHARILPTGTGFEIEDLGSTNGTYVDDQPIADRTPLANNDLLTIGDVPVRVLLRQAPVAVPVAIPPVPQPLPAPERASQLPGPSTVYYDLDEALAQVQPVAASHDEVPTAWDVQPARHVEAQPQVASAAAHAVEQPTLVGADLAPEPTPPPLVQPVAQVRSAPPPPSHDVLPTPPSEEVVYEPRPSPPPPTREPLPTAVLKSPPTPAREARPAPTQEPLAASVDLSPTELIQLADQLAIALRRFKGDASLALWLFDHAGGPAAAHAFTQQVERVRANPTSPDEQARLLDQAPAAARLLEAAILLANVVSSLGTPPAADNELQSNASKLEPVARA
ncbi:MAG: FHA domain-containing protein [Chloroflexi bacterium]|nr:FHA domain-containing protein [Chloroflexota bacterium]